MADFSKILTEAWIKVNEGIGYAANSIADATKEKVNEINLNNRRNDILGAIAPKILELYHNGIELPEDVMKLLAELTDVEAQLAALHPASAPKADVQETSRDTAAKDVQDEDESDDDIPVIHVATDEIPAEVEDPEPVRHSPEAPVMETPDEVDYDMDNEPDEERKATEKARQALDELVRQARRASDAVADRMNKGSEKADETEKAEKEDLHSDIMENIQKAADKVADAAKQVMEHPDQAVDAAAETIGKVADQAVDYAKTVMNNPDKAATQAADRVSSLVDEIGKAASRAAKSFTDFVDGLGGDKR